MPTRENCQQLEALLDAAAALVETKKVVDKVEHEIRVLEARKAELEKGDDSESKKDGMDMDDDAEEGDDDADADADADGETDRAASTAPSARSMSRKRVSKIKYTMRKHLVILMYFQQKRSMSISSVGSAATTGTRMSRKRLRT